MNLHLLIQFVIAVVVVGGIVYLLNLAPIDATIKRIATWIIIIAAIIWTLMWLGHLVT
jgi:hypothetical protein